MATAVKALPAAEAPRGVPTYLQWLARRRAQGIATPAGVAGFRLYLAEMRGRQGASVG